MNPFTEKRHVMTPIAAIVMGFIIAFAGYSILRGQSVNDVAPAMRRNVYMEAGRGDTTWWIGSGVLIGTNRVLTVAHMLAPQIKAGGKRAKVLKVNKQVDLMLLEVETDSIESLHFDFAPHVLEPILAVGNPLGKVGYVQLGRITWMDENIINTSTQVMGGMSGSGIYNSNFALVGILSAGQGTCEFGFTIPLYVPMHRVMKFLLDKSDDVPALLGESEKAHDEPTTECKK